MDAINFLLEKIDFMKIKI